MEGRLINIIFERTSWFDCWLEPATWKNYIPIKCCLFESLYQQVDSLEINLKSFSTFLYSGRRKQESFFEIVGSISGWKKPKRIYCNGAKKLNLTLVVSFHSSGQQVHRRGQKYIFFKTGARKSRRKRAACFLVAVSNQGFYSLWKWNLMVNFWWV